MYLLDDLVAGDRPAVGAAAQDAWREYGCHVHGELDFAFDTGSYRGRLVRQRTSTYQLIGWTGEAELIKRDTRGIRRDPRGHYELLAPLKGDLIVGHGDTRSQLQPGEMALVPIDAPFTVSHAAGAVALTLLVPCERIDHRLRPADKRGRRLMGEKGLSRVSRDLVVSLLRQRNELSGTEFDAACDRVVDLLCLAADGADRLPDSSGVSAVLDSVRRYVREHATDPDVSVAAMAAAIGWSPRYIQAVLAQHGTTATDLIRGERLELARIKLANRTFTSQTIAAIAASVGFASASAFSNAYRQRFGCSPRDTRRESGQPTSSS